MAKIIGIQEKQAALKNITQKLKSLEPVNEFLGADNPSGLYTISFDSHKSKILCKDSETIKALVFAYKKELVDDIRSQAEKFSIEFEENEEALLR